MIGFTSSMRYYLYAAPTDMRKGYYGLGHLVREHFHREPTDGGVYIFMNRRRDKMKLLVWDRSGYVVYYKSLEQGTFELPKKMQESITWETLVHILEGVKLDSVEHRKRYKLVKKSA